MTHECSEKANIEKLTEAINGNGKLGLKTEVVLLNEITHEIKKDIKDMAVSLSAVSKSIIEFDATKRQKWNTIKLVAIIFGIALPLTALIISLL